MVERNLAKVEVESSRLFSRSIHGPVHRPCRRQRLPTGIEFCNGDDFPFLQDNAVLHASMVKLVDTADLKSAASLHKGRTGSTPVRGTTRYVQRGPHREIHHGTLQRSF